MSRLVEIPVKAACYFPHCLRVWWMADSRKKVIFMLRCFEKDSRLGQIYLFAFSISFNVIGINQIVQFSKLNILRTWCFSYRIKLSANINSSFLFLFTSLLFNSTFYFTFLEYRSISSTKIPKTPTINSIVSPSSRFDIIAPPGIGSGRFRNYYHYYHIYWPCRRKAACGVNAFDLALINNHYCRNWSGECRIRGRLPASRGRENRIDNVVSIIVADKGMSTRGRLGITSIRVDRVDCTTIIIR